MSDKLLNDVREALVGLVNLAQRGRYDVDVAGAQQVTAIITRAVKAVESIDQYNLENNNEDE